MFKKLLNRRSSTSSGPSSNPSSSSSSDRRHSSFAPPSSSSGPIPSIQENGRDIKGGAGVPSVPPPAYEGGLSVPRGNAAAAGSSRSSLAEGEEDPFDFLRSYDTLFLIDDSGSMAGSRWRETRDALASVVATAAKYDDDGLDIHFLNSRKVGSGIKSSSQVLSLFSTVKPGGGTPTGTRLETLLSNHIELLERAKASAGRGMPKPLNIVILTDGEPSDDPRSVIIAAAKRLDRGNFPLSAVGLFFLQIGNDAAATEALAELDDDLGSDIRDIVDTAPYKPGQGAVSKDWVIKVLMGGINRRIDRRAA